MDDVAQALSRFCSSARRCQATSSSPLPPRWQQQQQQRATSTSGAGVQELRAQLVEARTYSVQLEGRLRAAERAAAHRLELLEALRRSREHTRQREHAEAADEYLVEVKRLRRQLKEMRAQKQEERQQRQLQHEMHQMASAGHALRGGPLMRLLDPVLHACGTLTAGVTAVGRRAKAFLDSEDGWFEGQIDDFDPVFRGAAGLASDEHDRSLSSPVVHAAAEGALSAAAGNVEEVHSPRPCWHIAFDDGDEAWMEAFADTEADASRSQAHEPAVASHLRLLDEKGDTPVTILKRVDIARAAFAEFERAMAAATVPSAVRLARE